MSKIYKNDVGKLFLADTGIALATATKKEFHVKDELGNVMTWTADIYGTTQLQYTTTTPDFATAGMYRIQAYVEFSDYSKHLGETYLFKVFDLFQDR